MKSDPSLEKEIDKFIDGLRHSYPQYASVAYPDQIGLDGLPLRMGETFVEVKVTDESTLVWIARNVSGTKVDLLDFRQVLKPRKWFGDRVLKLRKSVNGARPDQIDWGYSEELFNALFPSSASKILLESQRIVFVPDDILSVIPFE